MPKTADAPNPDLRYEPDPDHRSRALRLALLLDVFTSLERGLAGVPSAAGRCRCDPDGIRALLDLRREGAHACGAPHRLRRGRGGKR